MNNFFLPVENAFNFTTDQCTCILIRIATLPDLDFVYGLYMHPAVNPFLLYEFMEKDAFAPIYKDLLAAAVKFIYCENDQPAGMFKLVPFTHRSGHIVYLGGLAIDPRYAGKGYGKKMLEEIIAFAGERGFLRIELSVAVKNEKAISLYQRVGFMQEGILKKYTFLQSKNEFLDEVLMAYLYERTSFFS